MTQIVMNVLDDRLEHSDFKLGRLMSMTISRVLIFASDSSQTVP